DGCPECRWRHRGSFPAFVAALLPGPRPPGAEPDLPGGQLQLRPDHRGVHIRRPECPEPGTRRLDELPDGCGFLPDVPKYSRPCRRRSQRHPRGCRTANGRWLTAEAALTNLINLHIKTE